MSLTSLTIFDDPSLVYSRSTAATGSIRRGR